MGTDRTLGLMALTALAATAVPIAMATPAVAATPGQVVITEWQYNGSEFVELSNVGTRSTATRSPIGSPTGTTGSRGRSAPTSARASRHDHHPRRHP
jgi:hypothetical protein